MHFVSSLLFVAATSLIGSLALPQAVDPTQDATSCGQLCGTTITLDAATKQACLSQPASAGLSCLCTSPTFVTAVEACITQKCPQFSGEFTSDCKALISDTGSANGDSSDTNSAPSPSETSDGDSNDEKPDNGAGQRGVSLLVSSGIAFFAVLFL